MPVQFTDGRFHADTDAGAPLAGGRLYTYVSGTTTHKATYTDYTLATPNTYVDDGTGQLYIALNSRGEARVWLAQDAPYTMVLKTSAGVTVWTSDGVSGSQPASETAVTDADDNFPNIAKNVEAILAALGSVKGLGVAIMAAKYMSTAELADVTSHTGSIDVSAAVQSAIDDAAAIAGTSIVVPYDTIRTQGVEVLLPPGKLKFGTTVEFKEGVHLRGAGKTSTIIVSSYNGEILRNATPANYDAFGMGASGFTIMGDRTKTSQIGMSILRDWFGKYEDITVYNCGSHGWVLYQCIGTEVIRPEAIENVGRGFYIRDGITSWTTRTNENLPSNAVVVRNIHCYGNDATGIYLGRSGSGIGVQGCQFYGGSSEYNYKSSSAGTGYNIEIVNTNSATPNQFDGVWCEDTNTFGHVSINLASAGEIICFTNFRHFGNGAANYPAKAINLIQGTLDVDGIYGSGAAYKTTLGTNCPIQLTKASGVIRGRNVIGSTISATAAVVADETGATTGLESNVKLDNHGNVWGGERRWYTDFGQSGPSFYQSGQTSPYVELSTFYKGILFGPGTGATDALLTRSAAGVISVGSGQAIKTPAVAVASLIAAGTAGAGARMFVNDANATTFNSVVAGGGANLVPVFSDGTNWRIG